VAILSNDAYEMDARISMTLDQQPQDAERSSSAFDEDVVWFFGHLRLYFARLTKCTRPL